MTAGKAGILKWKSLLLAKNGNRSEDNEDQLGAFSQEDCVSRFAVADGASETIFADVWARLLVDAFLKSPPVGQENWTDWLTPVRQQWWQKVTARKLSWTAEHKIDEGAAAAILGLNILPDLTWNAVAVGDCCFFQMRDDTLLKAFPMTDPLEFDNTPELIVSRSGKNKPKVLLESGICRSGDELLLMSDALGQWFLNEVKIHHQPAKVLDKLLKMSEHQNQEVDRLRSDDRLRNDDVALIQIKVLAASS